MSFYLKNGDTYRVTSKERMDLHEVLPGGNFTLDMTPQGEFYLIKIDNFDLNMKFYGNIKQLTKRILHSFLDRTGSTGVLLAGEKGSGKTLLAKNVCLEATKLNIPAIIINGPWVGDVFNRFIQQIDQPCIILFDEFEKVYNQDKQQAILTLLDGVFPSQKLFMLTTNDKYGINFHMRNRPGRIYYLLEFKGIEEDFIKEYCEDNLKNKEYIDRICKISTVFDVFNFDMLKAIVEEMNRFNEPPQEALTVLNAKPEFAGKVEFDVKVIIDNEEIESRRLYTDKWVGNPMISTIGIEYEIVVEKATKDEEEVTDTKEFFVTPNDLKKIDHKEGQFTYKSTEGHAVILSKKKLTSYDYYHAF